MRKGLVKSGLVSAAMLFTITGLSGCMSLEDDKNRETSDVSQVLYEDTPENLPEHIAYKVTDDISVDAEIHFPDSYKQYAIPNIQLRRHLFEVKDVVDQWGNYCNETWKGKEKVSDDLLENGEPLQSLNATYANGGRCHTRSSYFSYCGNYLEKGISLIGQPNYQTRNGLEYATNEDLSFATVQEAEQQIRDMMENLGIQNVLEERTQYTATMEGLQKAADAYGDQYQSYMSDTCGVENTKIEKKDELYQFIFSQGYDGIPYLEYPVAEEESGTIYSYSYGNIDVWYGQKGIDFFETMGVFDFVKKEETAQTLLAPGKILDLFFDEKQQQLDNEKLKVIAIKLEYLPKLKDGQTLLFEAVPVWCILYEETPEDFDTAVRCAVYEAVDGRECEGL